MTTRPRSPPLHEASATRLGYLGKLCLVRALNDGGFLAGELLLLPLLGQKHARVLHGSGAREVARSAARSAHEGVARVSERTRVWDQMLPARVGTTERRVAEEVWDKASSPTELPMAC